MVPRGFIEQIIDAITKSQDLGVRIFDELLLTLQRFILGIHHSRQDLWASWRSSRVRESTGAAREGKSG
jgi:hypothetical protein